MDFDFLMLDFDNTLLQIPNQVFNEYIPKKVLSHFNDKIEADAFFQFFKESMKVMLQHDHDIITNLEAFLKRFSSISGFPLDETIRIFRKFYSNDFPTFKKYCEPIPKAQVLVKTAKELDIKLILATQPVFPKIVTKERLSWANLNIDDFYYISHAENSTNMKPNPKYFRNLLEIADVKAEKVLMVGNDMLYDMSASTVGIKTWLVDKNHDNIEYKDKFRVDYNGSLGMLINDLTSTVHNFT